MKNGTLSNVSRLVLISSDNDVRLEHQNDPGDEGFPGDVAQNLRDAQGSQKTLIVFLAVSIACMTVAVASGSYAFWLFRRQAARQTLTDVADILKSCQIRMQQLEAEVQRLPGRDL